MADNPDLDACIRYLRSTRLVGAPEDFPTTMAAREATVALFHALADYLEATSADPALGYDYAVDFLEDTVHALPPILEPVRRNWPATTIDLPRPDDVTVTLHEDSSVKIIDLSDDETVKGLTEDEQDAIVAAWGAVLAGWPETEHPLGAKEGK